MAASRSVDSRPPRAPTRDGARAWSASLALAAALRPSACDLPLRPARRAPAPPPAVAAPEPQARQRPTTRTSTTLRLRAHRAGDRAAADPLAVSPEIRARIGSDWAGRTALARGPARAQRGFHYEERRGDYRLRLLPPFVHRADARAARSVASALRRATAPKTPKGSTASSTTGDARSKLDMDVVFPGCVARARRRQPRDVAGPVVHREAPGETRQLAGAALLRGRAQATAATSTRRSC